MSYVTRTGTLALGPRSPLGSGPAVGVVEPPPAPAPAGGPAEAPARRTPPPPPPPPPPPSRKNDAAKEVDPAQEQYEALKRLIHTRLDRPARHEPHRRDRSQDAAQRDSRGRRAALRHRKPALESQRAPATGQRDPRRDVRLRAARALAQGRQDRRHHDQRAQERLCRERREDPEVGSRLPRQRAPAADHRPDRLPRRPPRRRDLADGRRPAARRLAVQRHHPAPGARRAGGHDPDVRLQAALPGRSAAVQGVHPRDARRSWKGP